MSHLNLADLIATRHVSRYFFEMVQNYQRFQILKASTVLLVSKETVGSNSVDCVTKTITKNLFWGGIKVDVSLPSELILEICSLQRHILKHIHFVSLFCTVGENNTIISKDTAIKNIFALLSSTQNLCHLQMDIRLLDELNLIDTILCSRDIKRHLRTLKHLDILHFDEITGRTKRHINSPMFYLSLNNENNLNGQGDCFLKNFLQLMKISDSERSLETIRLTKFYAQLYFPCFHNYASRIPEILGRNSETLQELALHYDTWVPSDYSRTAVLPNLKRLTVAIPFSFHQEMLELFLRNQSSLEELDISFDRDCNISLFETLKLPHYLDNLKKLHLKLEVFRWPSRENLSEINWSFLENMKSLRDFRINRIHGSRIARFGRPIGLDRPFGTVEHFLESLPKNNQFQRLSFEGIESSSNNIITENERPPPHKRRSKYFVCKEYISPFKSELLLGFRNLKYLSFKHCKNAVNDQILQLILKEMTSLQKFEVSHCLYLTDAGFTGYPHESQTSVVSIKNLKGIYITFEIVF